MRILRVSDNLFGYYDGRRPGTQGDAVESWIDDGALSLGICSYAVLDGDEAIVYDTHVSLEHARLIRAHLERLGARQIRVVLSHWHLDHIAGNEAFADCEIIANTLTNDLLVEHRGAIEAGTLEGPPRIAPLTMPTTLFDEGMQLETPHLQLELIQLEIHSRDATVLRLRESGVLLAGDTIEDTVTYVSEPDRLELHDAELDRMRRLGASRIYPNHGDPQTIDGGGYDESLIDATQTYIRDLQATAGEPIERYADLRTFVANQLDAGSLSWFQPYERVHHSNLEAVRMR